LQEKETKARKRNKSDLCLEPSHCISTAGTGDCVVCGAEVILQFEADFGNPCKALIFFKGSYSPVHIPLGTNIPAQGLTELGRGFSQNKTGVFHK